MSVVDFSHRALPILLILYYLGQCRGKARSSLRPRFYEAGEVAIFARGTSFFVLEETQASSAKRRGSFEVKASRKEN